MKKILLLVLSFSCSVLASATDPCLLPMQKTDRYARLSEDRTILLSGSYTTGIEDTLVVFKNMREQPLKTVEAFRFSPKENRLLLRAADGDHYVYTPETKVCIKLSQKGEQKSPVFSANGNMVAFLRAGDIFLTKIGKGIEEEQVSKDGTKANSSNYVAKAFGIGAIMEFSPDGEFIAFAKNHKTYIYNIASRLTYNVPLPDTDICITQLAWTKHDNDFLVMYLNGDQKEMSIVKITADKNKDKAKVKKIYSHREDKLISPQNASQLIIIPDKRQFVVLEKSAGYNRAMLCSLDGSRLRRIAEGKNNVTKVYGYDAKHETFYFQSDALGSDSRGIYSADMQGNFKKIVAIPGTSDAIFSSDFKYLELRYSNRTTPHTYSVVDNTGKELRKLCQDTFDPDVILEEMDFYGHKGWLLRKKGVEGAPLIMSVVDNRNQWMQDFSYFLASNGYVVAGLLPDPKLTGNIFVRYAEAYQVAAGYLIGHRIADGKNTFILGNRMSGGVVVAALLGDKSIFTGGIIVSPVTDLVSLQSEELQHMIKEEGTSFDDHFANIMKRAATMKSKVLLLHSLSDGQNATENTNRLVARLQEIGAPVQLQLLTDSDESMTSVALQPSLYTNILRFVKANTIK
ncbi:MAG: DPP IV N-terminal domain-containing protein [Paludibacteraceae bacterium]|nr:DPP IV N-terminal domain-containing protein [Paludibacteraceae bacterium]